MLRLIETSPPTIEPLTLDEAKLHLRVTSTVEDALITSLIITARQICESFTGLALIERDYSLYLSEWPEGDILLPLPPLVSVGLVNIYDAEGDATVFDAGNYTASDAGMPGRIFLNDGIFPPQPGRAADGIEIQFTAGYGDTATDIPQPLIQGIKQLLAHLYENRGDDKTDALRASKAESLFQPFRIMSLV
ncbi:MAG: head-tail connector protein [Alphaproteobacteria bacterium]